MRGFGLGTLLRTAERGVGHGDRNGAVNGRRHDGHLPPARPARRIVGAGVAFVVLVGAGCASGADATRTTVAAATSRVRTTDLVAVDGGFMIPDEGYPEANAAAIVRNRGDRAISGTPVRFQLVDPQGHVVGSDVGVLATVEPGGTGAVTMPFIEFDGDPVNVRVTPMAGGAHGGTPFPVGPITLGADPDGDLEVRTTVTNPTNQRLSNAGIQCAIRQGGRIVGGIWDSVDLLLPGATVDVRASADGPGLQGDSAECTAGLEGD
jgi:hypothetical protein